MTLKMIETAAVDAADLPLSGLAGRLRLPDGWADVPEQPARLEMRLRAALVEVERRTGRVLIAREARLEGLAPGGTGIAVAASPLGAIASAEVNTGTGFVAVDATVEDGAIVLAEPVATGAAVRVVAEIGTAWDAAPPDLREAVLVLAERLEADDDRLDALVTRLIAPYRQLRLGGAA